VYLNRKFKRIIKEEKEELKIASSAFCGTF
jgi:hypothetical protein